MKTNIKIKISDKCEDKDGGSIIMVTNEAIPTNYNFHFSTLFCTFEVVRHVRVMSTIRQGLLTSSYPKDTTTK